MKDQVQGVVIGAMNLRETTEFNTFIKDLDDGTECACAMFADGNKLGAVGDEPHGFADIEMGREETQEVQQGEMPSPASGEQ